MWLSSFFQSLLAPVLSVRGTPPLDALSHRWLRKEVNSNHLPVASPLQLVQCVELITG